MGWGKEEKKDHYLDDKDVVRYGGNADVGACERE